MDNKRRITEKTCNRCGNEVEREVKLDYPYYCPNCDENMYEVEVESRITEKTFKHTMITKRSEDSLKAYINFLLRKSPKQFINFMNKRG